MLQYGDGYPGRRPARGPREPGSGLFDLFCSGLAYAMDRFEGRNMEAELAHLREMHQHQHQQIVNLTNSNFNLQQKVLELRAGANYLAAKLEKYEPSESSAAGSQNSSPDDDQEEDE